MLIPVFLPILLGGASYFIPFRTEGRRRLYVMLSLLVSAAAVWMAALTVPEGTLTLLPFTDTLSLNLRLDGAGRLFSCLAATLWPLTALYAFDYMKHEQHLPMFYCFFTVSFGVTIGIAMAENILTMYLFYELLTLTTIPLVMHGMTKMHNRVARKYMAYSFGGAAFAFATVVFLILNDAETFTPGGNLTETAASPLANVLYLFAFLGFGVKAAVFPLHGWLPSASVAPTPVTALLHAVAVVKAGAFAIIRLTYYAYGTDFLAGGWAQYAVMAIAAFTIVYGSVNALRQKHLKRRLAYSTVANLSYVVFAVTLMTPAGLLAAFIHLISHSFIKIGAFFAAGAVLHYGDREYVPQLEGLGKKMPLTFACFTVFALSLTGIPPLCGFFSKWSIATAALEQASGMAMVGAAALMISAFLTACYMLSPVIKAFFPRQDAPIDGQNVKEADRRMLVPMLLCAVVCVLLGLFARIPIGIIGEVLGL
ncbi:MAG: proton-conducting membrane transporter [Clostridia bacterium]|nr:proton-conducting membrane transporter [Clostridia bacterium]